MQNIRGWKPDLPDHRDYKLPEKTLKPGMGKAFPIKWMLKDLPKILDQGDANSCTSFAVLGAYRHLIKKVGKRFQPSEMFLWYNTRRFEGTADQNTGAYIRDTMKMLQHYGVCNREIMPYVPSNYKIHPPTRAYVTGEDHQATFYYRTVRTRLRQALVLGFPVIFGFSVYENYEASLRDGKIPFPKGSLIGGHAVLAVGFDDTRQVYTILNSWGEKVGDHGYFYLPYKYVTSPDLSDDFWVLTGAEL